MSNGLRLVFAGTPEFAVPALDALHRAGHEIVAVYTQPDRPAGRGRTLSSSPVKRRALALGLTLEQPASLRNAEAAARLGAHAPDLMIVVAYGLILPPAILAVPRMGCWNIHASLLPRWRGAAPIQRAVLSGDSTTGVTVMQMDAGLDTGPMLLVRETAIGPRETAGSLHERLAALGAEAIVAAIDDWRADRLRAVPQPDQGVTYAAKIRKEEARIDWAGPAVSIERQVRAFNPWPVAETRWGDRQLRIWEAEAHLAPSIGAPGEVLRADAGKILVGTGEGTLGLLRVQLEGRRPMSAGEFLNAHALAGAQLG